jgi:uncharacterized protein YkwD
MSRCSHIRVGLLLALVGSIATAVQSVAYGQSEAGWEEQVLALENQARISAGCQPLTLSPQLTAAAEQHSQSMAASGYFSHTGSDGSTPWSRIQAAGYTGATTYGENIAAGYADPQSVVQAWLSSPDHRANILDPRFTEAGVGIYQAPGSQYGIYWTEDLAARSAGIDSPSTDYSLPTAPQPAIQPASTGVESGGSTTYPPVATNPAGPSIAAIGFDAPAVAQPNSAIALYGSGFGSQLGWVLAGRRPLPVAYWSDQLVTVQMLPGVYGWTGLALVRPDQRASNTVYVWIGY